MKICSNDSAELLVGHNGSLCLCMTISNRRPMTLI